MLVCPAKTVFPRSYSAVANLRERKTVSKLQFQFKVAACTFLNFILSQFPELFPLGYVTFGGKTVSSFIVEADLISALKHLVHFNVSFHRQIFYL